MAEASKDTEIKTQNASSTIKDMQFRYVLVGFLLIPFMPFFYLQGKYTRWKVGKLPDAEGDTSGTVSGGVKSSRLLAIGESSVAGVGVKGDADRIPQTTGKCRLIASIIRKALYRGSWRVLSVAIGAASNRHIKVTSVGCKNDVARPMALAVS